MEIEPCPLEKLLIDLKSFFDGYFEQQRRPSPIFKKHCVEKTGVEFSSYLGVLLPSDHQLTQTEPKSAFREVSLKCRGCFSVISIL